MKNPGNLNQEINSIKNRTRARWVRVNGHNDGLVPHYVAG